MAKKSPIDKAKSISCDSAINRIVKESPKKAFEEIDGITQEGLYFIRFDEGHVGYHKKKGRIILNTFEPQVSSVGSLKSSNESRVFQSFS